MTRTAWRSCHPDLRSSHGFRWPFPGQEAVAPLPDGREFTRGEPCPQFEGDGLCLAKTWRGAASGCIPAITCLLVEFENADVLGEDDDKVRVSRCRVVDVFDAPTLIRDGWCAWADLAWADLTRADLTGVNLTWADLTGVNLTWADLTGANLTWANLTGANLTGANLTRANLTRANLTWADLTGANLTRVNLTGVNLTGADLTGVNLTGADLTGANLTGANLTWANLTGANLTGANLTRANLTRAIADQFTRWPAGFDPKARGVTVQ